MKSDGEQRSRYPLLEALLTDKRLELRGTYTTRNVADIFDVSVRTIQEWVRKGYLKSRQLPGRARFLSEDIEQLLRDSRR